MDEQAAAQVVVHGITNCDSVKRARRWLADQGIAHRFHDFRKSGVPPEALADWMAELGWERLLNRQGTTWRKLDEARKGSIQDAASAAELMRDQPGIIRRPVVRWPDGEFTVGFDSSLFAHRGQARVDLSGR